MIRIPPTMTRRARLALIALAAMATAMLGAAPAQAARGGPGSDAASARAFVESVYARYRNDDFCAMCVKGAGRLFDPELVALLRENERVTPDGEIGAIDADPICDCQDPTGLKAKVLTVTLTGKGAARVEVSVGYPGGSPADRKRVVLSLAWTGGHWRIHDVSDGDDDDSFRAMVAESNRAQRAAARK
jgi:hypothetical protein